MDGLINDGQSFKDLQGFIRIHEDSLVFKSLAAYI